MSTKKQAHAGGFANMKTLTVAEIQEKQSDVYPQEINHVAINEKVQSLDMKNLSQADIEWLHDLKNLAQRIRIAEYRKLNGIPSPVGGR